jgi:hypothetical protein
MSADEHTEAGPVGSGGSLAGSLPDLPDRSLIGRANHDGW